MDLVMYNSDLRNIIFSFLRKDAKKKCFTCNKVCVWDKKIVDYIEAPIIPYKFIIDDKDNDIVCYCMSCWAEKSSTCNLL